MRNGPDEVGLRPTSSGPFRICSRLIVRCLQNNFLTVQNTLKFILTTIDCCMNHAIHTDHECWERLLHGDNNALYELYTNYYHTLLFIGLRHIHDTDLVKDVIQQQFLYFWEKRNTLLPAR